MDVKITDEKTEQILLFENENYEQIIQEFANRNSKFTQIYNFI